MQSYKNDKAFAVKTFEIAEFKAIEENGKFYIEGYSNTKNKPDSYGDIPTNFNGKDVYDLSRFLKNPVMFIDHWASASNIMGNFVDVHEDEIGLYFKALLKNLDDCFRDEVKEAVRNYQLGFARALSIGGRWFYDDPNNPTHLTRAYIHEISGVGVGADPDALCNTPKPKSLYPFENSEQVEQSKASQVSNESKSKLIYSNLIKKGVLKK